MASNLPSARIGQYGREKKEMEKKDSSYGDFTIILVFDKGE